MVANLAQYKYIGGKFNVMVAGCEQNKYNGGIRKQWWPVTLRQIYWQIVKTMVAVCNANINILAAIFVVGMKSGEVIPIHAAKT